MKQMIRVGLILLLTLTACGPAPAPIVPAATPTAPTEPSSPTEAAATAAPAVSTDAPIIAPTARPVPTAAPPAPPVAPLPTIPPTQPVATLSPDDAATAADLKAFISAQLPVVLTPDANGQLGYGFGGINAYPVSTPDGGAMWLAHSYGMRNFEAGRNHFIALYRRDNGQWQRLLNLDLENPDYIDVQGVRTVAFEPNRLWLQLDSGVGAHSGCFDLYAIEWNGRALADAASNCNSSPGAGEVRDVDGDGQLDVVLVATEYYVFCYACGVTYPQFRVLRWTGDRLAEQVLTPVSSDSPAAAEFANPAVRLAQGGRWKDAMATVARGDLLNSTDPLIRWNAALIRLHAEARQAQVQAQTYPLLNNLFYGDYEAVLALMRPVPIDQLFSRGGPLIKGTVAEGWEDALSDWVAITANAALTVDPDLAEAYFLRGWAAYLMDPNDSAVRPDLEKAAQLKPGEKLFADALAWVK